MLRDVDDDVDNNKEDEEQRTKAGDCQSEGSSSPKGEEVNLLVSAQIKMLLNANEATQWGKSQGVFADKPTTHYTRYAPLPLYPHFLQKCPLELWQLLSVPLSGFHFVYFPCKANCDASLVLSSCHIKPPPFSSFHNAHAKSRLNLRIYRDTIHMYIWL